MSTERDGLRRRTRDEQGAALVEFALIFPIFMTVVLGMFTGGIAYNRKISMTNAVAEASRYGATLAPATLVVSPPLACLAVPEVPSSCGLDQWVLKVGAAVIQNAEGNLGANVSGREICVAYVHPAADSTASHNRVSHLARFTTSDTTPSSQAAGLTARCISNDGRPNDEKRVQITVKRNSPLDALFFRYDLDLTAQSVTRFEAVSY